MGEKPLELSPKIREWLKAKWHYTDEEIDTLCNVYRPRYHPLGE